MTVSSYSRLLKSLLLFSPQALAHTYYGGSAVDEILFIVHLNVHTYLVEYVTIFSNNYYQAYNQVRSDP